MITLLAPLLAIAAPVAVAREYVVILEVTTDAEGAIIGFKVSSVIDPLKGTAPVKVDVPDAWLAAARAQIEARGDLPKSRTYFTYLPYTAARPR